MRTDKVCAERMYGGKFRVLRRGKLLFKPRQIGNGRIFGIDGFDERAFQFIFHLLRGFFRERYRENFRYVRPA